MTCLTSYLVRSTFLLFSLPLHPLCPQPQTLPIDLPFAYGIDTSSIVIPAALPV